MNLWESYYDALKRQDWKKALKSLGSLKKIEPGNPQVHLKIGDLFRRTGDISDAKKAYNKSADFLVKQGFIQKALAVYKIILSIDPADDEAIEKSKEIIGKTVIASTPKPEIPAVPLSTYESISGEEETSKMQDFEPGPPPQRLPYILSFLSLEVAEGILRRADIRSYNDGMKVIEEGDSGDSIFIIKSGHAKVISHIMGMEVELANLSEGDVFGEVGFLTGRLRTASVIAKENLEIIELGRSLIVEIIERNPEVLKKIEDIYGSRVEDTVSKVKSLKGIR